MQSFTRALTREITIAGQRLALTLNAEGLAVRPVGSRKAPVEISWSAVLCHLAQQGGNCTEPTEAEVTQALSRLASASSKKSESKSTSSSSEPTVDREDLNLGETLQAIDAWLREHRSRFHPALRPGAQAEDLEVLRKALKGSIPDELTSLLTWHDGQTNTPPGAFYGTFYLLSSKEIAHRFAHMPDGMQQGWIPFLEDDQGNYLILDPVAVREVWRGGEPRVVAESLSEWFAQFLQDLEAGRYHEDPERGGFHRAL